MCPILWFRIFGDSHNGREVEVVGLNEASATLVERFAVHDKEGQARSLPSH